MVALLAAVGAFQSFLKCCRVNVLNACCFEALSRPPGFVIGWVSLFSRHGLMCVVPVALRLVSALACFPWLLIVAVLALPAVSCFLRHVLRVGWAGRFRLACRCRVGRLRLVMRYRSPRVSSHPFQGCCLSSACSHLVPIARLSAPASAVPHSLRSFCVRPSVLIRLSARCYRHHPPRFLSSPNGSHRFSPRLIDTAGGEWCLLPCGAFLVRTPWYGFLFSLLIRPRFSSCLPASSPHAHQYRRASPLVASDCGRGGGSRACRLGYQSARPPPRSSTR